MIYRVLSLRLLAALLFALSAGACEINKAGKSDNFEFSYDTDDRLVPPSFNQSIAEGLSVNVNVRRKDGGAPVTVTGATSANTDVVTVPRKDGSRITLKGEGAGTAEISVRGGGLEDAVDVKVEAIETVELKYPGPFLQSVNGPVAAVVGGDVPFPMSLKSAAGLLIIGYGVVPVTVDPDTAGAQVATEDVAHVTVRFTELGHAKLRPLETAPLDVTVVAPSEVAELTLEGLFDVVAKGVALGSTGFVALKANTADAIPVVGLTNLVTLVSDSPAICKANPRLELGDGTFDIEPLAEGSCRLVATYEALSAELTIAIKPAP